MDFNEFDRAWAARVRPALTIDRPLLIDGCMILYCVAGTAVFSLNFNSFTLNQGEMLFLFDDMVIVPLFKSDDFEIEYAGIDAENTYEVYLKVTLQKLYNKLYLNPVQRSDNSFGECVIQTLEKCIHTSHRCSRPTSVKLIANYVVALFTELEDIVMHSSEDISQHFESTPWRIMGDFFVLLAKHYTVSHEVSFYSSALCITPQYLNRISRTCTGRSAKETITDKLMLAMKALLESTNMSIKCISDRLHYEDPSYLCRVFRRHTGMSPLEYRKSKIHI